MSNNLAERSQCASSKSNKIICLVANSLVFKENNFGKLDIVIKLCYTTVPVSYCEYTKPLSVKYKCFLSLFFPIGKKNKKRKIYSQNLEETGFF